MAEDRLDYIRQRGMGGLADRMSFEFLEFTVDRAVARMPVENNTDSQGVLPGSASVALAESLGSMHANLLIGDGKVAVGLEINATHTRNPDRGYVTGTCIPIFVGDKLTVHEISITDDGGELCSTVRITNYIKDERRNAPPASRHDTART